MRYDAGMSAEQAAHDIDLGAYRDWGESERIAVNVDTAFREFRNNQERTEIFELFRQMAELAGYTPET